MTDPSLTQAQTTEPLPKSLLDAEAKADAEILALKSESQNTVVIPPAEIPAATPTPAPQVQPQVPQTIQPSADEQTWETRFKVLQGKYNAEVNKDVGVLQTQVANDRAMIQKLMDQVDRLTQTVQTVQAPATPAEPVVNTVEALDPEDYGHYGTEIVSLVENYNKLNQLVANQGKADPDIVSRLDALDSKITTNEVKTFESELSKLVPDWEARNLDKGFITWLENTLAPYSSDSMYVLLNRNWKAGNIERTAEIFNSYKSQIATANNSDPTLQPTLENQAVPDTTNVVVTPEGEKVPLVTEAELEAAAKRFQSDPSNKQNEATYEDLYTKFMQQQQKA